MQTIIILKGFNNYYNRKLKYYEDSTNYLDYAYDNTENGMYTNINFNPNDGIRTEHIFNFELNDKQEFPDYLLVLDEKNEIISRWYILESTRLRNSQYRLNLKRDTLADNINSLFNVPINLEKVGGFYIEDDIAITNKEPNISVNQIKTKQELIKDNSGTSWIVGYTVNGGEYTANAGNRFNDYLVLDEWEEYSKSFGDFTLNWSVYETTYNTVLSSYYTENINTNSVDSKALELTNAYTGLNETRTLIDIVERQSGLEIDNANDINLLYQNYDGKIYKIGEKFYKQYIIKEEESVISTVDITPTSSIGDYRTLYNIMYRATKSSGAFTITYKLTKYKTAIEEVDEKDLSLTISATRNNLKDAPYSMFIAPFNDVSVKINATDYISQKKEDTLNIINALANKYASESAKFIYDIQILPYCPIQDIIDANGNIDIYKMSSAIDYDFIYKENIANGVIIYPTLSSFTFRIPYEINYDNLTTIGKKIENQCSFYRLCSPNYSSIFEFNPILNKGVDYFNISCTYKPYQPYIKVAPNFKYLYGGEYKDNRGLILGGDYSLPIVTDAWESYQLSNKNLTNIFERSIQNMETQYKYQNIQQMVSSPLNAISTGLTTGMLSGNIGYGILGGGASLLGGIADMGINRALQQEQLDYTKTIHEYQMQNIQALPNTLSRIGAYNIDTNYFPFLEYYTCTSTETQQLENMLKYNGYTYNRIDTLNNFISYKNSDTFFKGTIVRNDRTFEDYHMLNDLNSELNQGIYLNIEEDING